VAEVGGPEPRPWGFTSPPSLAISDLMQSRGSVAGVSVLLVSSLALAPSCKKEPSASDGPRSSTSAATAAEGSPAAATNATASAVVGASLSGLDACLVGTWKSTVFTLKAAQATAEGGANTTLRIGAGGDAVVDFAGMAPISGKGAGADFDFIYAGKATATVSTPTRGAIASTKADISALRVSANVSLPGAGKFPVLKNKSVSELSQMASAMVAGKAPAGPGAAPAGVDSNPLFSATSYACEGNALTLSGDGPTWAFTRTAP
jgi:hypothetical protein